MATRPSSETLARLGNLLGPKGFTADADALEPWLTDWRGRYRGAAAAMVSPASVEETAEVVRICAEAGVPLVPQGGNSSMVAGATPPPDGSALLLSMRRMNRVRSISPEANLAICEAGVILSDLHSAADGVGRRFPLSLGAKGSATIGGLTSTNAGGTQVFRFGTMRSLVQGIEAVLPDGSILSRLSPLKKDNRGYDLKHLLIGAEGTLGVVTAVGLTLVPAIGSRTVVWVGLASPYDALALLRLFETRLGDGVESFELIPDEALRLVLTHVPGTRDPLAAPHKWHALVEVTAPQGAPDPAEAVTEALRQALELRTIEDAALAANESQADSFWRIRESISEAERKDGPGAKHDISVAVEKMPGFITHATEAVEKRFPGVRVIAFGHLGDGNVHFNARAPQVAGSDWLSAEAPAITAFVHDLVTDADGSISAEHGIGQARLSELARLADPAHLSAMRAIKLALDPKGLMNPGKLVPPLA